MIPENKIFWNFDADFWYNTLNSSENGLTQVEALELLSPDNASNKVKNHFQKDLALFLGQYKSPLMLLLIGAVILSSFLGDTSDVFIISFILLSTGILSFFQERKAGRVVEKLQSMISLKSLVLRDGIPNEIELSIIVPGDVIILKAGDIIPSDCLIIQSNELNVNEASLTGESFPVRKENGILNENTLLAKRTNCLWKGTNCVSGTAKALVINTGKNTIFENIIDSSNKNVETTFEKGIKDFGFFLMKITLVLSSFILIVNLLNHNSIIESALFALALAVGMAPELLPAISTIAMSEGAKRLLAKKVIVKRLSSIQNLGEVDLLCTDKTGTITEGAIVVNHIYDSEGVESDFVKLLSFWNAKFETGYTNPIDEALKNLVVLDKSNTDRIKNY
jgi:Mg2+-importing ATPase